MFRNLLIGFTLLCCTSCGNAQADKEDMLKEATRKLKENGSNVSALLTDKTYLPIHQLKEFQELVRDHAAAKVLTITTPDEPGKKIKINCTLSGQDGKPIAEALVYLYQTDTRGWYSAADPNTSQNQHARLFGYVKTDASGKFELETIKPNGYPNSEGPGHIHVHVTKKGAREFVTEFLFDDDPRLQGEVRRMMIQNQFLVAKPETALAPFEQQFNYKMVLPW